MRELSRRIFACLVVTFCLSFFWPCLANAFEKNGQEDDQHFITETQEQLQRLEKLGFAGVVLITRDGAPLLAQGYGLADRERGIRWTPATVSTIGSITKQFTGAGILKLQEDGLLRVTNPISRYFQSVPEDKRAITLHHLLTHSSGLLDPENVGDWDPVGRDEYIRLVLDQPLAFPPGDGYEYANANFSLLAAIIEQLTGKPYEKFLRERLFLPCGMYETGYILLIHPANEPYLIAGVATYAVEILEDCPRVDMIIVPVGGGSGASGCCLAKRELRPEVQVVGVQAEKAPAAYLSWKAGKIVSARMETVAEGLQTQMGYELTQEILRALLADFILVSDEEMSQAILTYLELVRNLTEEAGAAPLAAALKIKEGLKGKTAVLVLSGSNISLERLGVVLKLSRGKGAD